MVKKAQAKPNPGRLNAMQLEKLQALAHPERYVDETFNRTEIGAFLLKENLIAPNPEPDTRKAFIVTPEGYRAITQGKKRKS